MSDDYDWIDLHHHFLPDVWTKSLADIGITEISGVQGRLTNLGYDCGKINGKLDSETREALLSFQKTNRINETGEADSATLDKLEQLHGS